ncbi:Ubiquinone biosynthesis monooxygenase COQ6, mitochondrial [Cyphellophora attinorum]|uniref:Ubiquinone biosynthesis monooxygenase COQ6, mitochondrial n=1 Tax=Cyphellophora attinorum TaxID=1664694 RepID=A0A0N0NRA8_9EURO|nr:Ubiquinone biosynthesis monooxygenase COQ6, mitochondrial [Phialophora attinorum]KPI44878.1 Ubiquinone biosynthesis monooxygenase COQ6, mitochondrial [Phialophora attinorum]
MLKPLTQRLGGYVCRTCRASLLVPKRRHYASSATPEIYDVVTVGGGPVGLALLAALKASPKTKHLRTALIEFQDLAKQQSWSMASDHFSNRASSLTPASVEFLEQSGTWSHIEQERIQPYNAMQVWDASNDAVMRFDWRAEAQRYNAPPRVVATMTENANLTRALLNRIHELNAGDSLMVNTKVGSVEMGENEPDGADLSSWPTLSLEPSAPKIAARLLVGADGFNSPVRAFAGISSHGWDYHRHGVVATLKVANPMLLEESGTSVAYQRFLPQLGGPIAILPLPNGHASLVWSTTPANASFLKSIEPAAFVAMVNAAVRCSETDLVYMTGLGTQSTQQIVSEYNWRNEHTKPTDTETLVPEVLEVQENSVASFPLRFRQATTLTGPRIALVGDAAHTIHPLAGQGLNLGLADARWLAETIAYAVEHGMDLGDSFALERYSSDRFGKGLLMGGSVDALNWIYQLGSGDGMLSSLFSNARGLGMKAFSSNIAEQTGLKGAIMRVAEGA